MAAVALVAALALQPAGAAVAKKQNGSCPLPANKRAKEGKELDPKITLKPEATSEIVNFGGERGTRSVDVVLLASKPLPKSFSVKQLEMNSPKRFRRASQVQDSASLRMPSFSSPQIIEQRRKIRLRICVNADGASAGTYSGQINISGPPGLVATSINVTANVKTDESTFFRYLVLALLTAFLLLLFKAAKEAKEKAEAKTEELSWPRALWGRVMDLGFVVSTVIALVAAFVAMRGIYDSSPAWGTEPWANVFALCGTAFGAAGVGSLITAFTPKSD